MAEADMRHRGLLDQLVRPLPWNPASGEPSMVIQREWIVTNGLGGYASGTVCGLNTRRYHGTLVAALPNPLGRIVMLNRVQERVITAADQLIRLDVEECADGLHAEAARHLLEFRLEAGLPVWRYAVPGAEIEKRLLMVHGQNTVHVRYVLVAGDAPLRLELRPAVHFRSYEGAVSLPLHQHHLLTAESDHITIGADSSVPCLRLNVYGEASTFELHRERLDGIVFSLERARGYDFEGSLWTPGHFRVVLTRDKPVSLVASSESWDIANVIATDDAPRTERERRRRLLALAPVTSTIEPAAELVLAADQFLITPVGRHAEAARARAIADEVRTVIAGYHWFTDWGRDTMISLEGLTLVTGRHREAGFILRTFARYVRDGLIPNMFPDGSNEGLYHTADATMWFFHALDRYVQATGDRDTLALIVPVLRSIVQCHVRGTRFGIGVDERDGLLHEGAEGYQLTWMDAKVGDWVVTPRRGKPVEINALWYNALRLFAGWLEEFGYADEARDIAARAELAWRSFNARFWYEPGGYLYDV
ncbi:MAG TPA: amylo-alpha-1,6-glucosidase, partial [Casimicrobiaceae bacterium]|nr:amylo-alpha-1,6-glucosidase [Casimicrobiaceae bacterium]